MDNEQLRNKIVDFGEYCKKCEYFDTDDTKGKEPCNSCLAESVNEYSKKPVNFKEKGKVKKEEEK